MHARKWGSIVPRRDATGEVRRWQAKYVNPIDPSRKVYRTFDTEGLAERWLDEEHRLVELHRHGSLSWTHPDQRQDRWITFDSFAREYFRLYRKKDGRRLSQRTMRIVDKALERISEEFGDTPLCAITEREVRRWYDRLQTMTGPAALVNACTVFRRVMKAAAGPQPDNMPPLISYCPCTFPIARHRSERMQQRPLDRNEISVLVGCFPDYDRLAIWLALLVGGLRIGEVCGLQMRDIDIHDRLLYVRHSVNRGPTDAGPYRLSDVKTPHSRRTVPIPVCVCSLIEDHIRRFCPDTSPEAMLFHSPLHPDRLLAPTTVAKQMRRARERLGRPEITFHSLRATHATMFMIEGGTLRETMDELGHSQASMAIECYQRIVPEHRREVAERLAIQYVPAPESSSAIRDMIRRKELQIDLLRKEIDDLNDSLARIKDDDAGKDTGR